jgi:hypothetical protein
MALRTPHFDSAIFSSISVRGITLTYIYRSPRMAGKTGEKFAYGNIFIIKKKFSHNSVEQN